VMRQAVGLTRRTFAKKLGTGVAALPVAST